MIGSIANNAYAKQQDTGKADATATANATQDDEDGLVAYSDTTATADSTTYYNGTTTPIDNVPDNTNDLSVGQKWLLGILGGTAGVGATIFALIVVILVFLFLCSPIIVIGLIIWYLVRRNNQRLEFARKAMESGQPIPQEIRPEAQQTDSHMWSKGIKNAFLGVGISLAGMVLHSDFIVAIGAIVLFMGVGQAIIAKTSSKKNKQEKDNGEDEQLG